MRDDTLYVHDIRPHYRSGGLGICGGALRALMHDCVAPRRVPPKLLPKGHLLRLILRQSCVHGAYAVIANVLDLEQAKNGFSEVVILAHSKQGCDSPFGAKLDCGLREDNCHLGLVRAEAYIGLLEKLLVKRLRELSQTKGADAKIVCVVDLTPWIVHGLGPSDGQPGDWLRLTFDMSGRNRQDALGPE